MEAVTGLYECYSDYINKFYGLNRVVLWAVSVYG